MEKKFPLDLLFSDGTSGSTIEAEKKVVGIRVSDKNVISLRNNAVKDNLDGAERRCNNEAARNKEGVVTSPPSAAQAKEWMDNRKEINATIEMLQEQGVPADKLEGVLMTATRSGKFDNYVFNMATGEKELVSATSTSSTIRPFVSIDTAKVVQARNYDDTAYGKAPGWRKSTGYNSGYDRS